MRSLDKFERLFFFVGIVFIFIFWLIASYLINNTLAVPKIGETFNALVKLFSKKQTYIYLGNTLMRLFIVVLSSFAISILLTIISIRFKGFSSFLSPIMSLFRTMPVIILILLIIFMVGRTKSPIYLSILIITPVMYEAMYNGSINIDKKYVEEAKMLSKNNFFMIRKVYIPLIFPYVILAILQALGMGLKVIVMTELLAQTKNSIGKNISDYQSVLEMGYVLAWGIVMVLIVMILEYFIRRIKRRLISY